MAGKFRGAIRRFKRLVEGDPFAFLKQCNRIVHVGANTGQEREVYSRYGLDVLWIEPIPEVYDLLVQNISTFSKQDAVRALVTDRDGELRRLHIANNQGASSSILDLALHKDVWPDISYVGNIEMKTSRLDTLLEKSAFGRVDALVMDTQGSENLVLVGAPRILAEARFVKTECADFEAYAGCAMLEGVTEQLAPLGFRAVRKDRFATHPNGGSYFDVLFRKN